MLNHYLSPNDATQWRLSQSPEMKALAFAVSDPGVGSNFPRKKITSSAELSF